MSKQVLDDVEGMLDFGTHACLEDFKFLPHVPKLRGRQRFAQGAFHRHVPLYRTALVLDAFLYALVTGIGGNNSLLAVQ